MALIDMKSDLAKGVGSKQTPQSFQDGHSATTVTGQKSFGQPPRIVPAPSKLSALSRQSEQLNYEFGNTFNTPSIVKTTKDTLDSYYNRAFKSSDPLGARNNDRLGFDEPFVIKGIGDRWGPGGLGKVDFGLVRAGVVTQAARTVADVQRIGKFLLTPRGVGFILKQNILQKMNANGLGVDGVPQGGSLVKKIGDILGGKQSLPGPKQQRFSITRDVFKNRKYKQGEKFSTHTVDELAGSDIRSWRVSSIIDSLPIGAHGVRHLQPAGSPSVQLLKNVGNFVVDTGGGVLKFIDGIDVAFPQVSLNPNFQAGSILTGVGGAIKGAANGIADIFPNISGNFKLKKPKFDIKIGATDKPSLGRMFSITSMFPFLIDIPTPRTPNLSGIQNILGGLADTAANLLKGVGGGIASALGGISLPSISLPPLPNFPSLPDISLPNLPNPFSAIGNAVKGINIGFPKFAGKGGLGLGSLSLPDITGVFPSIRLNADITPGFFQTDLSAFGPGGSFRDGLQELIKSADALGTTPANAFAKETVNTDKLIHENANYSNKNPYGIKIVKTKSQMIVGSSGGKSTKTGQDRTVDVNPIYSTFQPSVANDFRGGLTNIFDKGKKYSTILISDVASDKDFDREYEDGKSLGIGWDKKKELPFAISSGFVKDINGASFPLNVKAVATVNKVNVKFPKHIVNASKDKLGNRIQRYEMLSYGQLDEDNRYGDTGQNADSTRGIGSQGGAGRLIPDPEIGVVRMSDDGKYSSHLQDKINLHPYGGSTISENINDTNIDFIPFKFRDMVNGKWIIFRAILESVADTSSPEYSEESYIGRPDKVYVYKGSTRNFNVTFKVMPKSVQELITIWEKLNYLRGLTYPTIKSNRMIAPFASITVGDMVDKLPVLIQSLNYSVDTQSTWEIKPGLRLPKLIQISADMRVIEPKLPQTTGKFYDLDWLKDDGEFGTFDRDPSRIASLSPKRLRYEKGNHNSRHNWPHLFDELGIEGVTPDILASLIEGDDAIFEMTEDLALLDEVKSNFNFPNPAGVDVPNPITSFSWK